MEGDEDFKGWEVGDYEMPPPHPYSGSLEEASGSSPTFSQAVKFASTLFLTNLCCN